MKITLEQIKELRQRTGVGIHQVKEALTESAGDMEKAIIYLRQKGLAKAGNRASKDANFGLVETYLHSDKSMGVILELNSETDFAARSDDFKNLAHDIAIHIAAMDPQYIDSTDIPSDIIDTEKKVFEKELEGKPDNVKEKILEGKLQKFYEDVVLMEQKYVKDDTKKVKDLLNEAVASLGEKIIVARFARIKIGGESRAVRV